MRLKCRFLDLDDLEQFRDLRLKALKTDPTAFGSTYEREINLPIEKFERRLEKSDNQFVIGAFYDDKLVCVASFVRETDLKNKHKAMIFGMYCDKEYRGTGAAKKVISCLLEKAKSLKGLEKISLMVMSENTRAIKFYEHFGFIKYGTEPRALYDGFRYYDEDLMYLYLRN